MVSIQDDIAYQYLTIISKRYSPMYDPSSHPCFPLRPSPTKQNRQGICHSLTSIRVATSDFPATFLIPIPTYWPVYTLCSSPSLTLLDCRLYGLSPSFWCHARGSAMILRLRTSIYQYSSNWVMVNENVWYSHRISHISHDEGKPVKCMYVNSRTWKSTRFLSWLSIII